MDPIFGIIDPQVGGWATCVTVLVAIVTAVWRGWLVPRPTVDRLEKSWEQVCQSRAERLSESTEREKEWRAAWLAEQQKGSVRDQQVGDLLELARTTDALVRALPRAIQQGDAP